LRIVLSTSNSTLRKVYPLELCFIGENINPNYNMSRDNGLENELLIKCNYIDYFHGIINTKQLLGHQILVDQQLLQHISLANKVQCLK